MPKKKKQSKLRALSRFLKPNSPKKGFILFAIVFAVAGGTYAVYKSHAQSWTQYPNSFCCLAPQANKPYFSSDSHGTNTKGVISVLKMPGGYWVSPLESSIPSFETTIYVDGAKPRLEQYCANVRSPVTSTNKKAVGSISLWVNGGAILDSTHPFSVAQGTNYGPVCSKQVLLPPGGLNVTFHLENGYNAPDGYSKSELYVASVNMNW